MYPRKVNIKIENLPFICSDDEATALLNHPHEIENVDKIDRRRENNEGVIFHTREAQVTVAVRSEKQLKNLTRWSCDKRTKNEPTLLIGIPLSYHARRCICARSVKRKISNFKPTMKTGASLPGGGRKVAKERKNDISDKNNLGTTPNSNSRIRVAR